MTADSNSVIQNKLNLVEISPAAGDGIRYVLNQTMPKEKIFINNRTDMNLAFKVKRTMPKAINVTPGYGFLKPMEGTYITVNVTNVNDEDIARKADHHVSVVVCKVPPERFTSAKHVWMYDLKPLSVVKKQIPITFSTANEALSSQESSTSSDDSGDSTDDDKDSESENDSVNTPSSTTSSSTSNNVASSSTLGSGNSSSSSSSSASDSGAPGPVVKPRDL